MALMSVEEWKCLRAEQRKRQGYTEPASPSNVSPATVIEVSESTPSKQASPSKQPAIKRKVDTSGFVGLVQASARDPPTDPS